MGYGEQLKKSAAATYLRNRQNREREMMVQAAFRIYLQVLQGLPRQQDMHVIAFRHRQQLARLARPLPRSRGFNSKRQMTFRK